MNKATEFKQKAYEAQQRLVDSIDGGVAENYGRFLMNSQSVVARGGLQIVIKMLPVDSYIGPEVKKRFVAKLRDEGFCVEESEHDPSALNVNWS